MTMIPIKFEKVHSDSGLASFDAASCPSGGTVVINGETSNGGWVFCGIEPDAAEPEIFPFGLGEPIGVTGGSVKLLRDDNGETWSGDMGTGRMAVTHDGVSEEIVVVYATHAD